MALKRKNGADLDFVLTENEERILKVIYYEAKAKLASKSDSFKTESLYVRKIQNEHLKTCSDYQIRTALKKLEKCKLVKVFYKWNPNTSYRKSKYVRINCSKFDKKYCWTN